MVRLVNMASGGLDSTLVGVLAGEEGADIFPLFIDYGQRAAAREWCACQRVHKQLDLPKPTRVDLSGFGNLIQSGLTNSALDIRQDAFTPGRNFLFLLIGSAYAYQIGASMVSIGLLSEQFSLFPDQRSNFVEQAERAIALALNYKIQIVTPLSKFSKTDVVYLATKKKISGTYSCHAGGGRNCGKCISCLEVGFK